MYMQYRPLYIDESPLEWWKLEANRMPILTFVFVQIYFNSELKMK